MSLARSVEARPLDHVYDSTYTSGAAVRSQQQSVPVKAYQVSGKNQLQYIRGPVMARLPNVPPHALFGASEHADQLVNGAVEEEELEPFKKNVEVQTVYRESESQTDPYTPAYVLPKGENPEVLVLSNLSYGHGLPVGPRELYMVAHARRKRELELSLPPFTDAASLALRRKLMEQQERREFELREAEIDEQREQKLQEVAMLLQERNDSAEFLAEQKLEALRQTRVEKRLMALEKIKAKRFKVLRNLVQQRDQSEPRLNDTVKTAVIDKYFDKTSELYAPMKRTGTLNKTSTQMPSFTEAAFEDAQYVGWLEKTMTTLSSRTLAVNVRSTSAYGTRRSTTQQKKQQAMTNDLARMYKASRQAKMGEQEQASRDQSPGFDITSPLGTASTTQKGRPVTPDFVQTFKTPPVDRLSEAVLLLQRLLRGRATQNIMADGRMRRQQLIRELQYTPGVLSAQPTQERQQAEGGPNAEEMQERMQHVCILALDAVICSYISKRLAELSSVTLVVEHEKPESLPPTTSDSIKPGTPPQLAQELVDIVVSTVVQGLENRS